MRRLTLAVTRALLLGQILLLFTLWGCQDKRFKEKHLPPKNGVFRMNIGTEPPTLDPALADDLISMTVLSNLMQGLTQYDTQGRIAPGVASHWTVSPDGTHYRFHLRPQAKWSDGKPVTAQDFVDAWRRVLSPQTGSHYAFLLFDIQNAKAYYDGQITNPEKLGLKAIDSRTLDVSLARPTAFFLQIAAFSITYPQRTDNIKHHPDTFTEAQYSITNGAYTLARWDHENQILLKPNPHYWAGPPKVSGVQMVMIPEPNTSLIMYENNELDFIETTSSLPAKEVRRLKYRPDYYQKPLHAVSYMGFNVSKAPFNDVRVRKAFIQAFDRTAIAKIFQAGEQPTTSLISPGMVAHNPNIGLPFNVEEAKKHLAEAGYPNGKGFPPVELLFASTSPETRQLSELAQFEWHHHLNVPITLKAVEWKVFLSQLDSDPPALFRLQWYVDYPDPDSFMNLMLAENGNNHTRWHHPQYERWVKEAAITKAPEKRKELYDKAQRLLLEDEAAFMPLYVIPKSYLLKPYVRGFRLNTLNVPSLEDLYWQTAALN